MVRDFLQANFAEPMLVLAADAHAELISELVSLGVTGGAAYDALVGATARGQEQTS